MGQCICQSGKNLFAEVAYSATARNGSVILGQSEWYCHARITYVPSQTAVFPERGILLNKMSKSRLPRE